MKFLLKTVILLVSLTCVILLIAFFLPKDYTVERSVRIDRSPSELYDYLRYLKSQEDFSPWLELDPRLASTSEGIDGEVGAISKWNSKIQEVGKGEQEITKLTKDEHIEYALRFEKPIKMEAKAYFHLEAKTEGKRTELTWGFTGESSWPWNISLLFMDMEAELGKDLDKGLKKIKKLQEEDDF